MKDKKYYIALDDFERRVVVNCMNEMRNSLIENGKCTEALDEVLLKVIQEGVSEQLKADNQIEWVGKMNNIRQRATEIINHDIIYN